MSPKLVHTPLGCGLGLWLTQSDARYLCGQLRRAFFRAATFLNTCLYPPKRKSYVLSTSVLDLIAFDFWINEKAATPHHERQEDSLPLGFVMLCSSFEIQNPCQPCRLADISILYLCAIQFSISIYLKNYTIRYFHIF